YPIGFPLALAAGQALHAERAVVPVLTGLLALLVAWVGLAEFGASVTTLALALYLLSPQVLLTGGATLFSQAVSAPCLIGALGCLSAAGRGRRHTVAWLTAAGALLSYGVLARPLPGVLFCGVAFLALAAGPRFGLVGRLTLREWIAFLAPL